MKEYYYLDVRRKVQGPHRLETLAAMLKSGMLQPDTEIASPGDSSWVKLGSMVTSDLIAAASLPPVPGVENAPGKCPSCGERLGVAEGALPQACPACGRLLRTHRGGFWANVFLPILLYGKFSGRATRAEYWTSSIVWALLLWTLTFGGIIVIVAGGLMPEGDTSMMVMIGSILLLASIILALLIILPLTALQVRRLHDIGWSGWWMGAFWLSYGAYMISFYLMYGDSYQMMGKSVREAFEKDGIRWMEELQMQLTAQSASPEMAVLSLLQMVFNVLALLLFVVSFFDSQRGPNKYGPSSKYPMG